MKLNSISNYPTYKNSSLNNKAQTFGSTKDANSSNPLGFSKNRYLYSTAAALVLSSGAILGTLEGDVEKINDVRRADVYANFLMDIKDARNYETQIISPNQIKISCKDEEVGEVNAIKEINKNGSVLKGRVNIYETRDMPKQTWNFEQVNDSKDKRINIKLTSADGEKTYEIKRDEKTGAEKVYTEGGIDLRDMFMLKVALMFLMGAGGSALFLTKMIENDLQHAGKDE